MEKTIGTLQDLQYRNVISKYLRINLINLADNIEQFLKDITDAGYTVTELFFYSINSPINDGTDVLMEFFVQVIEDYKKEVLSSEFHYHSHFQVLDMVATRIEGDSIESFGDGIKRLEEFITPPKPRGLLKFFTKSQKRIERTPPFFLTYRTDDKVYTDIMIGVHQE